MTRLTTPRSVASAALAAAIVTLAAGPAGAQPPFPGFEYLTTGNYVDRDLDGVLSCGDDVEFMARIGIAEGAPFPVQDGEFGATMLANGTVVVGSVVAVNHHPAGGPVVVTEGNSPGDVDVRVDLGVVCPPETCPEVDGDPFGATVTFFVRIREPNFAQLLTVPGFARASNYSQQSSQPSIPYEPCEPPTGPGDVDLFVEKDDGGATAPAGSVVAYEILYGNDGTRGSTGAVLTDTVPSHAFFEAAGSTAGWTCADGAPAGTVCTLAVGNLPAGSASSATFAVRIASTLPAGVELTSNTVTIADDGENGPDDNPADNTLTDTTPIAAAPDLAVAKDDGGVSTEPGAVVVYALDFGNLGTQGATGVVLRDTVPDAATFEADGSSPGWSCADGAPAGTLCTRAVGPLGVGETGAATFAVRVDPSLPPGANQIVNVATIVDDGANGADLDPSNDSATDTTPIAGAVPDLFVVKDDGGATVDAGGTVVYDVSFGNVGTQGARRVEVSDVVPAHAVFDAAGSSPQWSCSDGDPAGTICSVFFDTLSPGETDALTFAVRVAPTLPAGVDELVNMAVIADDGSNGPDPDPGNNTSTDTTPIDAAPDLGIAKDDAGVTAGPGSTVVYSLAYANAGTQDATGVEVSDGVPRNTAFDAGASSPGWSCSDGAPEGTLCTLALGAVGAGDAGSRSFAVRVLDVLPPGVDELTNTAAIADDGANGPDLDPADNTSTDTTPVIGPAPGPASLDAFKSDDPERLPAQPGDAITYTVVIANDSDATAAAALFESDSPAHAALVVGTVSTTRGSVLEGNGPGDEAVAVDLGDLAAGEEAVVTFQVLIDEELPPEVTEIACQGSVTAEGLESIVTDDPDTPAIDDPTRTPVVQAGGPVPVDIPTAGTLGLALLVVLLAGLAVRRLAVPSA